jgi:hypothetical protein
MSAGKYVSAAECISSTLRPRRGHIPSLQQDSNHEVRKKEQENGATDHQKYESVDLVACKVTIRPKQSLLPRESCAPQRDRLGPLWVTVLPVTCSRAEDPKCKKDEANQLLDTSKTA